MAKELGVKWKTRDGQVVNSKTVSDTHLINAFNLFCKTGRYVTRDAYYLLKGLREELCVRKLYTFEMDWGLWRDVESRYHDWIIESVETDWESIRDDAKMWGND